MTIPFCLVQKIEDGSEEFNFVLNFKLSM